MAAHCLELPDCCAAARGSSNLSRWWEPSQNQGPEVWQEDGTTDTDGSDGADEHGTCSDILGRFCQGVAHATRKIDRCLDGGIEPFSSQDNGDGDDENQPLPAGKVEEPA